MSITTKYTLKENTTPPPVQAFRGVTKTLQFYLVKLFTSREKTVWLVRGPDSNQTITGPGTSAIPEILLNDRFPAGIHRVQGNIGLLVPALAVSAKLRFTLDGSESLLDHEASWVVAPVASHTGVVIVDVLDLTEGPHVIGLDMWIEGADSATIYANESTLVMEQA